MKERIVIRGIVIREVPYGEADKLLNLLTREYGLITVSAKHSRRPKSNMLLATSALTYGEYEISGNESSRFYLNSANVIEAFMPLRNDIVLLTYCAHMCDLILDAMRDASSADEVFRLVLYTLERLSRTDADPALIIHTFELKLLYILGFTPLLEDCTVCGHSCKDDKKNISFSFTTCGIVCCSDKCFTKSGDTMHISAATLDCLRYIAWAPIEKLYSFRLEAYAAAEMYELASKFICERLERCYTKLKMLDEF